MRRWKTPSYSGIDPSIAVKIENCVFGGSMKIDGKLPKFNELGSGGQDDYTGVYPFSSVNSFRLMIVPQAKETSD